MTTHETDTDPDSGPRIEVRARVATGFPTISAKVNVVTVEEQLTRFRGKIETGWEKLRKRGVVREDQQPPSSDDLWISNGGSQDDLTGLLAFINSEYRKQTHWENAVDDAKAKMDDPDDDAALEALGRAPIVIFLEEWINRPKEASPYCPKPRASVPSLQNINDYEVATLPDFTDDSAPEQPEQLPLPGFEPTITTCPSWILWLYDRAGGDSMRAGRGAPWDLHLFVGAFLHLAIKDRTGQWIRLRFPHLIEHEADWPISGIPSIERWFFPDGWDKGNKSRYWGRLPEALHRMSRDLSYVPVNELGSVAMVFPSVIPERRDQPLVEFTIRVPGSAATGARIDWDLLRKYRKKSAPQYRAYLSASAFIDRSAHRGHGITAEIGAPLVNADGRPMRREGGAILRGDEMIPNPQAQFVKPLDSGDLTRMIGFDPNDRRYKHKAIKAFEALHEDGVIDLQKTGNGWKIFMAKPGK